MGEVVKREGGSGILGGYWWAGFEREVLSLGLRLD